jgi:hypothetical protein
MAEHPLAHRKVRITKLQRAPEGFWTARLSLGGATRAVHCRHGSWMVETKLGRGSRAEVQVRHVLPEYAQLLQDHVRRAERREARIGRDCQADNGVAVPPASRRAGGRTPVPAAPAKPASSGNEPPQRDGGLSTQRKESAMPTATESQPRAAREGSLMSHVEKALRKAEGPMTAGQLVDAMPKSAFSAKAKAEPFYQVYGRLSAGVKTGKVVKVDKGLFDLAELNPKGAKKRPSA